TPGTSFMVRLNKRLTSQKFVDNLKSRVSRLKTYIFSGFNEPGEGEKKIVNYLRNSEQNYKNYVIFSPDSDMVILGLLLNTSFSPDDQRKVSTLKIIRHDQQRDNYGVIEIDTLNDAIYDYVTKNMDSDNLPDRNFVIWDISFLFTAFGNDFVPKIESINVNQDVEKIMSRYTKHLNSNPENYPYLISYNTSLKQKRINQTYLLDIIKELQKSEGDSLRNIYMSTHYHNYDKLKKMLGADPQNFTTTMNEFLDSLRKFNYDITHLKENQIVSKWETQKDFIRKLQKLVDIDNR
ncbi:unnamed protein product, partial [marine sediment metagenome]